MKAIYISENDLPHLQDQLNKLKLNPEIKSVLFLMADEDSYSSKILESQLQKVEIPLIGGVFPELIFEGKRKKKGVILLPLSFTLKTQLFCLSGTSDDFLKQLESVQKDSLNPSSTLFVFTDALSNNKEVFVESLFNFFGINPSYIGGGAGSLQFKPFGCIIDNNGMYQNAAVIAWADKRIALGVAHGWEAISMPIKVTKANGNKLEKLNWKPAFDVYKEVVESHSGMKFTDNNFFEIAKSYPLGIAKMDAEMVVRDPFEVSNNVLHFIDSVNEGEYVSILHGNMDSLLKGALKAKEIAFTKCTKSMNQQEVFCIDCISRALFMDDAFEKELEVVGDNVDVTGILTIGEIANSEESFLEIYNKTVVIGVW